MSWVKFEPIEGEKFWIRRQRQGAVATELFPKKPVKFNHGLTFRNAKEDAAAQLSNNCREPLLAKSHWKLQSEVSKASFFENNYGFAPEAIGRESPGGIPLANRLLLRNTHSPHLQFSRGFKTRRSGSATALGNINPSHKRAGPVDVPKAGLFYVASFFCDHNGCLKKELGEILSSAG